MIKKLLFWAILTITCTAIYGQTGNESLGSTVQPNAGNPAPYDGIITLGTPGGVITSGDYNTLIGDGAGSSLISGVANTFIGTAAGTQVDNDSDLTIIGAFAFDQSGSNSFDNVVIGTRAARTLNDGDNVVIGTEAGVSMTTAADNVIIGEEAGGKLISGDQNVIIGEDAGFNLTTGSANCLIGTRAGYFLTGTSGSTFVGAQTNFETDDLLENINNEYSISTSNGAGAGGHNTTGLGNTFIGSGAGGDNGAGNVNTFIGYGAGANNEHGDGNTFIGYGAGYDNNRTSSTNNANRNTYLGMRSGGRNREGSDNVGIGYNADFNDADRSRSTFIGSYAKPYNNDVTMFGYNTQVGGRYGIAIGTSARVDNEYSVAIGTNVTVAQNNTMALGGDQTTNRLSVGIGTVAANRNASLELADVDKGLLLNRVTNAERTAMETTPASGVALTTTDKGLMVYDTDDNSLYVWDGTAWVAFGTDTDNQKADVFALNINNLELSLENDGTATQTVDLSGYLDNTDDQNISGSGLAGNTLTIGIEGGASQTVDLSPLNDSGTDNQNISGSGLAGNTLTIGIEGGASETVDLSPLQDGTGTDNQGLTAASLTGTVLRVEIENGAFAEVDLAAILAPLVAENAAQQAQIDDLIARMVVQENCVCGPTLGVTDYNLEPDRAYLSQNLPNPFDNTTMIGYFVPFSYSKANIVVSTVTGQILDNILLSKFGEGSININKDRMQSAIYLYTLYVDGKKVDTKKMVVK